VIDARRADVIREMWRVMNCLHMVGVRQGGNRRKGMLSQQKAAHWKAIDRVARSWEIPFREGARRVFKHELRDLLALVNQAQKKALQFKATVNWEWLIAEADDYYAGAGDFWRQVYTPLIKGVVTDQVNRWSASVGMQWDVQNLFAREWFNSYTTTFANPITATSEREIAALLNQAQAEGWSIPGTQDNLETLFRQWMDGDVSPEDFDFAEQRLPPYRTEMIARTETIRASNAGSFEQMKEWGVRKKEWLSTQDDRTRGQDEKDEFDHFSDWPQGPNGEVVGIDEPFTGTGEEMMYPGDPSGSPGNFINCRCALLPVLPEEQPQQERDQTEEQLTDEEQEEE